MDQEETIKDFYGRPLAYLYTKSNGDQYIKDTALRTLGFYYKDKNTTTDFYGRPVGTGNLLTTLIGR